MCVCVCDCVCVSTKTMDYPLPLSKSMIGTVFLTCMPIELCNTTNGGSRGTVGIQGSLFLHCFLG